MEEQSADGLVLSLSDPVAGAHFIKEVRLREGQRAIYLRHVIGNLEGRFTYGHHPILAFPEAARPGAVRTGAISFGQVYPGVFEDPATGGKSCLAPGARFTSLAEVPLARGGLTSLEAYPTWAGCEDLVMYAAADTGFGWTAVHFPDFVWMALKNSSELPSTLLWHSNGGRPYPPRNGRHLRRLGVADVCSYFHEGVEISLWS